MFETLNELAWREADRVPVGVWVAVTAAYLAYHYGADDRVWARRLEAGGANAKEAQTRSVLLRRALGAAILGGVPAAIATGVLGRSLDEIGLGAGVGLSTSLALAAMAAIVVLPVVGLAARGKGVQRDHPEIRRRDWTPGLAAQSAGAWVLYLFGYELCFRGVLLLPVAAALGPWPAIATHTGLYAAVHLVKAPGEGVGSFLMGFLFGSFALATGSIVGPFVLHAAIALTSETVARRARMAGAYPELDDG